MGTPIGKWVGMRRIGFVLLLAVVLAGCSVPASEAPRNAVEQTSSALNAAHWAVEPVSYTHLDVYKRQGPTFTAEIGSCPWRATPRLNIGPVLSTPCLLYTSRCV